MKILKKCISKKKGVVQGNIVFVPIDNDDVWYLYNIIDKGNLVETKIKRKITKENESTSNKKIEVKVINFVGTVVAVNFLCDETGTSLILKLKNIQDNKYIAKGQMQSVEVKLNQKINVIKEEWDFYSLKQLDECMENSKKSEIVVLLIEEGKANLFFLKNNYIVLRQKFEKNIPKKKGINSDKYKSKLESFFKSILDTVVNIDKNEFPLKCLVFAGPGNTKSSLKNYITSQVSNNQDIGKELRSTLNSAIIISLSNIYEKAIEELFKNNILTEKLEGYNAFKEHNVLEEFFKILRINQNMVVYGNQHVSAALEKLAIKKLLITDKLLKNNNFTKRKEYNDIINTCKKNNIEIVIFNQMLPSGKKLQEISGIAAILNYELHLDDLEGDSDSDSDSDGSVEHEKEGSENNENDELYNEYKEYLD